MTTEIAVMNRLGVAIAADSAVTITFGSRSSKSKIFSTNKLFMLSKHYPVGIMIFGNASLMGIPWEILIKEYRKRELCEDYFERLEEYGASFIKYLNGNTFYFTEKIQIENLVRLLYREHEIINEGWQENIYNAVRTTKNPTSADAAKIIQGVFDDAITKRYDELNALEPIDSFKITERRFEQKYGVVVEFAIDQFLKNDIPTGVTLSNTSRDLLRKIAYLAVVKSNFENNSSISGIVIAGYGEKEIYPSLISYDIEMVIDNKLKFLPKQNISVDHQNDSFVEPFAQEDMVKTFLRGVSPDYEEIINEFIDDVINDYPNKVADKLSGLITDAQKKDIAEQLTEVGQDYLKTFRQRIDRWVNHKYYNRIKMAVAILPVEELASMAAALVNLTSQKRRYTPDEETVGGAVDVAVITKADGFVWIDRKFYFEKEKNPHFFTNYYRGANYEKQQTAKGKNKQRNKTK
jgi:hypothetical protein